MITLKNIHFSYGKKKILQNVTFAVAEGEIVALIGSSGSGKTTLFKIISTLLKEDSGELLTTGKELTTYMQQEDLLLPWRKLIDNILLFAELGNLNCKNSYREKAKLLLRRVGLEGAEELFPDQLSGGMRQRAALARALLQERPLLLLDEPFGSLDLLMREELYKLLLEIRVQYNKTMILVTHDFRDALSIADRILILKEGTITESFVISDEKRGDPLYCNELSEKIKLALANSALPLGSSRGVQRAALI